MLSKSLEQEANEGTEIIFQGSSKAKKVSANPANGPPALQASLAAQQQKQLGRR